MNHAHVEVAKNTNIVVEKVVQKEEY